MQPSSRPGCAAFRTSPMSALSMKIFMGSLVERTRGAPAVVRETSCSSASACAVVPALDAAETVGRGRRRPARALGVPSSSSTTGRRTRRATSRAPTGPTSFRHARNRGKGAASCTGPPRGGAAGARRRRDGRRRRAAPRRLGARGARRRATTRARSCSACATSCATARRGATASATRVSNFFLSRFARRTLRDTQCGLRRYPVAETLAARRARRGVRLRGRGRPPRASRPAFPLSRCRSPSSTRPAERAAHPLSAACAIPRASSAPSSAPCSSCGCAGRMNAACAPGRWHDASSPASLARGGPLSLSSSRTRDLVRGTRIDPPRVELPPGRRRRAPGRACAPACARSTSRGRPEQIGADARAPPPRRRWSATRARCGATSSASSRGGSRASASSDFSRLRYRHVDAGRARRAPPRARRRGARLPPDPFA